MSDFETNIRESFVAHFPEIVPKDSSYIMIISRIIVPILSIKGFGRA